jgi:hypothetical protein
LRRFSSPKKFPEFIDQEAVPREGAFSQQRSASTAKLPMLSSGGECLLGCFDTLTRKAHLAPQKKWLSESDKRLNNEGVQIT